MKLEKLVQDAVNGDKAALEGVAAALQDTIYNLALRMLVNPEDARDATQEILIKIITSLSSFRFESQLNTWAYRIATNHLISEKKLLAKDPGLSFDVFKEDLESDLQPPGALQDDPDYLVLLNELRISCTMAMLLCLNPPHRMAYILGDIMELDQAEAAEILAISKPNFRKQLSRARAKVMDFTSKSCGLVNPQARCHCENKLNGAVVRGRVSGDRVFFASGNQYSYEQIKTSLQQTQEELKTLGLQTSICHYNSPVSLSKIIESIVAEGINYC